MNWMAEYIEREALLAEIDERISNLAFCSPYQEETHIVVEGMERARDSVEDAPAADVAPVVHGEWVVCGDGDNVPWMCSRCGKTTAHKYKTMYGKYCPNCGSRMNGR